MIETELLQYRYVFIVFGTIFEGDATLLAAAFLAHRGYFQLQWVLLIASLSTAAANQAYFMAARRAGARWPEIRSRRGPKLEWIAARAEQHGGLLLLASRFMIGFRTLIPIVCGTTAMSPIRFLLWNSVGAVLWAIVFGLAGYLGGHLSAALIDDIRRHEKVLASVLALGCAGFILLKTKGWDLRDLWSLRRVLAKPVQ